MKDIFSEIVECLQKRDRIVLATIVSSSGSSPLPSGAMMLVTRGGEETSGSVGGGLLEALVIDESKKYFGEDTLPRVGKFDLNDDVSNEGMICGGTVDVLLESLNRPDLTAFQRLIVVRNDGSDAVLIRLLERAGGSQKFIYASKQEPLPDSIRKVAGKESDTLTETLRHSLGQEDVRRITVEGGEIILQPVKGLQNLVIFGGGHVSKYLVQIATVAGFSTTVIDDRVEFADPARFPAAARVFAADYEKAFDKIEVKPSTYIVILTRGHRFDEQVLQKALLTPAKYIGMIGSKRKVIACFDDLAQRGVSLDELRRVHAPIGLDIGAVSAEEIGVSIAAELVRVRRAFGGESMPVSRQLVDWFEKKKADRSAAGR